MAVIEDCERDLEAETARPAVVAGADVPDLFDDGRVTAIDSVDARLLDHLVDRHE